MLADVLERTRERTVDELERRAAASESTNAPWIGGRRRRLNGLIQEVIAALRQGRIDGGVQPLAPFVDPTRELRERELVRRYLIEEIEQGHAGASAGETALVSTWAAEAERRRLREQNERLRSLLDDVEESVALFAPDGRILYCNARTFERLREGLGVRREDVLGKTLAELGVPCELPIGRPMGDLMNLARRRETFQMNVSGRLKEGQFNAVYGTDGDVAAIELLIRDI